MGAGSGAESAASKVTISPQEADAIGEILNISMGSAATAVSTMLDRQVVITTPTVSVRRFANLDLAAWEPAMLVTIKYIEGIAGANMMVFHKHDIQMIINMLMGIEEEPSADFEFDELSMSAASEVMNQMMGSSATALSSFFAKRIDISTPEAVILETENQFREIIGIAAEDDIVSISFKMTIPGVLDSEFINIMECDLAKTLAKQAFGDAIAEDIMEAPAPAPTPAPAQSEGGNMSQEQIAQMLAGGQPPAAASASGGNMSQDQIAQMLAGGQPPAPAPSPPPSGGNMSQDQIAQMLAGNQMAQQPAPMQQQMPQQQQQMPQQQMQQMPQQMMQQQQQMPMQGLPVWVQAPAQPQPNVNVQTPQFPDFTNRMDNAGNMLLNSNMDLMMGLPLTVSVEIGKTEKKIKDIMDFTQGTIIELEKQAGAPVDIIVNGHLIARGDVVVIDDNFGVRITEIIRTRET